MIKSEKLENDFRHQGNFERIVTSIAIARERGATLRVGPELEIPWVKANTIVQQLLIVSFRGYGCLDHFLEGEPISCDLSLSVLDENTGDTVLHSWEVLAKILSSDITMNIVCDIGM